MKRRSVIIVLVLLLILPALSFAQAATIELLIHQNAPLVDYINAFNQKFQDKYPDIAVNVSVVNSSELATSTQTRLTVNDVDIIDMFGFAQGIQPYMKNADSASTAMTGPRCPPRS